MCRERANNDASRPLVSIIVPLYNVEQFASQCVRSISEQTYSELEIILIDDGSSDGTPAICDEWSRRDTRVRVIHQKNVGQAAARNVGIKNCEGEFIFCIDSDDYVDQNLVDRCISIIQKEHSDICVFRFRFIAEDNSEMVESKRFQEFPSESPSLPEESLRLVIQDRLPSYPWSFIARSKIYKANAIQFPVGRLMEDRGTTYRIFGGARLISYVDSFLYNYRVRTGSVLTSKASLLVEDELKNFQEMGSYISLKYPRLLNSMRNVWIWNSALNLRRLMRYKHKGIMKEFQIQMLKTELVKIIRRNYELLTFKEIGFNEFIVVCSVLLHFSEFAAIYTFFIEVIERKRRPSFTSEHRK